MTMAPDIVLSVNGRDGLESAGAAHTQAEVHRNLELVVSRLYLYTWIRKD
jgi:hypothetical protein